MSPRLLWVAVATVGALCVVLWLVVSGALGGREATQAQSLPLTGALTVGQERIDLEVARTDEERATGLMFRDDLPADRGMAFVIDPARKISLWTKNVRIPIDVVFLRDGVVLSVIPDVPPCAAEPCPSYSSPDAVDTIIELRAGRARELGLAEGTAIDLDVGP